MERLTFAAPVESTVVVADVVVEVKARLLRLTISVVALSNEDVTVLELDIGRALVEVDHFCGCECVDVKGEVVC